MLIKYEPKKLRLKPRLLPIIGRINPNVTINANPVFSEFIYLIDQGLLIQPKNIFEPSRGGNGNKLNSAKAMLKATILSQNKLKIKCIYG